MMSRDAIEASVKDVVEAGKAPTVKDLAMQAIMVELLLDIRDLLEQPLIIEGRGMCQSKECPIAVEHVYHGKD